VEAHAKIIHVEEMLSAKMLLMVQALPVSVRRDTQEILSNHVLVRFSLPKFQIIDKNMKEYTLSMLSILSFKFISTKI